MIGDLYVTQSSQQEHSRTACVSVEQFGSN